MKNACCLALSTIWWLAFPAEYADAVPQGDQSVSWFGLEFGDTPEDLQRTVAEVVAEEGPMKLEALPTRKTSEAAFKLTPTPDADSVVFLFEGGRLRSMSHHYGKARLEDWGGGGEHVKALTDLFRSKPKTDGRKHWYWRRNDESATLNLRDDGTLWIEFRAERMPPAQRPPKAGPPPAGQDFRALGKFDPRTKLERLEKVVWLDNAFNDGDSFHVLAGERRFIVRLFHVDCAETDDRYPDRIEEQRVAFGLPAAVATLELGKRAADFTARLLEGKELTVFTSWQNARGQSNEPRYYCYVMLPDGTLLGERLVAAGLARPLGSARNLPDGTPSSKWRAHLEAIFKVGAGSGSTDAAR